MFVEPLNNSLMELLLLYGIGMEMSVCFAYLLAGRQAGWQAALCKWLLIMAMAIQF